MGEGISCEGHRNRGFRLGLGADANCRQLCPEMAASVIVRDDSERGFRGMQYRRLGMFRAGQDWLVCITCA